MVGFFVEACEVFVVSFVVEDFFSEVELFFYVLVVWGHFISLRRLGYLLSWCGVFLQVRACFGTILCVR